MTEPFRDNELSVRERAAKLAQEIHDLDHQIARAREALERREAPPQSVRKVVLHWVTAVVLLLGVALGGIVAEARSTTRVMYTPNCGFH